MSSVICISSYPGVRCASSTSADKVSCFLWSSCKCELKLMVVLPFSVCNRIAPQNRALVTLALAGKRDFFPVSRVSTKICHELRTFSQNCLYFGRIAFAIGRMPLP